MSATVLAFPAKAFCDSCHRATPEDDLNSFSCCDARVCRKCHECDCDRLALELADRLADLRPGFVARLVGWVRGKLAA